MKKRRRHKKCLNCGQTLHDSHNYCSNCGQENTDNEVGVGLLIREFTSNFFSLDSRFGRTFKPFLFQPGKITNAFNLGKRVLYANPIRWYLVISLFHFFFFTNSINSNESGGQAIRFSNSNNSLEMTEAVFDSLYYLPDSLVDKGDWPLPDHYFIMVNHLSDEDFTYSQIVDSLSMDDWDYSWFRRQAAKKVVKLNLDSGQGANLYFLRQIPIIMFFILPLYAFLLKLFFWRKGLYVKHLIHSLHIHSFFFFIMGFIWIFSWIFHQQEFQQARNIAGLTGFLLTTVYILVSFKRVYKIKWVGNVFRLFSIGFIYLILVMFSMSVGFVVSLTFY